MEFSQICTSTVTWLHMSQAVRDETTIRPKTMLMSFINCSQWKLQWTRTRKDHLTSFVSNRISDSPQILKHHQNTANSEHKNSRTVSPSIKRWIHERFSKEITSLWKRRPMIFCRMMYARIGDYSLKVQMVEYAIVKSTSGDLNPLYSEAWRLPETTQPFLTGIRM